MTDGDHVKLHGGPQDGRSMWVPFTDDGPPDVLHLPRPERPPYLHQFDGHTRRGLTRTGPSPLVYRRRLAMSDEDHAWHYDFEEHR